MSNELDGSVVLVEDGAHWEVTRSVGGKTDVVDASDRCRKDAWKKGQFLKSSLTVLCLSFMYDGFFFGCDVVPVLEL